MDGSVVVTTRLSSDAMNSAADVMPKVHSVRLLDFICLPPKEVIDHLLLVRKKNSWRESARAPACPSLVDGRQVHGCGNVDQHSHGEKLYYPVERQPGQPLDQHPQRTESGASSGPDVRVVARRIRVHLQQQERPVVQQLLVSLAHGFEGFVADSIGGCCGKGLSDALEAPLYKGEEQRLLGREEAEEVRLADTGPAGDVLG